MVVSDYSEYDTINRFYCFIIIRFKRSIHRFESKSPPQLLKNTTKDSLSQENFHLPYAYDDSE